MEIIDGLKEIDFAGNTRIAIGKFDGIHAGHRRLIRELTKKQDELKSLIFTFSFSSESFLKNSERILSVEDRRRLFKELDVDYLVEYELNEQTASMEPEEFARRILKERLHCVELVCGPDLTFGHKGRGNVALLKELENELNIKVTVIDKVKYQGEDISSTRIREALRQGNIEDANKMLKG